MSALRHERSTTEIYINLAGDTFPEAAELLEERILAGLGKTLGTSSGA